ncbi:hypothetical protein HanHA300_Chr10g0369291 [Helianthus annuus]|nr:hypothetical protein HanHA300_Chr10g0369291 [Helianthus annuus]KAJ0700812.1 hypothetical protein HanOQP8_Chr10g0372341 [Helianthus annuus]
MTFFSSWGHRSTPFDACITSKVGVGQLTSLLFVFETGLNIQEAHVFSSAGGFLLDVFVVDGLMRSNLSCLEQCV